MEKKAKNTLPTEELNDQMEKEQKSLSLDDIENAPDDLDELFSEPPILELDFDDEPTDDELKLEEMDVDKLTEEDITFDNVSLDDPVKVYLREIGRVPLLSARKRLSLL